MTRVFITAFKFDLSGGYCIVRLTEIQTLSPIAAALPDWYFDEKHEEWCQVEQVPVNQGISVLDMFGNRAFLIADTTTDFNDFLFWVIQAKRRNPARTKTPNLRADAQPHF